METKHLLYLTISIFVVQVQAQCQSETKCECFLAAVSVKSSSSMLSESFSANQSALENSFNSTIINGTEIIINGGSWQPSINDTAPYMVMDFGSDKTIRLIITKGSPYFNYWVKEYNVYRKENDDSGFTFYKKLSGNTDANSPKQHSLNPMISARYLKIVPLTFENNVSLRIDIQGCDKVDGGWTPWEAWRKCRRPCGYGVQYRYRSCKNPVPKFLGDNCIGSTYSQQECNNHTCPDADMTLELLLPSETWNNDLLISPSTKETCLNLKSNLSEVYKPVNLDPFLLIVDCTFFPIDNTEVGVLANLTFNTSDAIYILKLQDGLNYSQRIHIMPAVLRKFMSNLVPYAPTILRYVSEKWSKFKVERSASMVGPATGGFDMFYRLETTDPDGEWSFIDFNQPTGSCDFSISWCETWGTKAFHNYTVRIMAFNTEGYGLATDPYRVTTKENTPSRPSTLSGAMNSSKSIDIYWSPVPLINMNGNSEGYQIRYRKSDGGNWQSIRILDHWTQDFQISGLDEYVQYRIQIRSRNTRYWSSYTSEVRIRTDEDIPSSPPTDVGAAAASSTSLELNWSQVPQADKNGVIINYKINISLGFSMTAADSSIITVNDGNAMSTVIPNLMKWSHYTMQIAASTIKGTSHYSLPVTQRTSEDRPDTAPSNFRGNATSSTEIHLYWDMIPLSSRHGILTQYHVQFHPVSNPASVGNKYFNGETTLQGAITGLLFWSDYNIDIAAKTTVGYGPRSSTIMIRTQEHAPTQSPESIIGVNTSSYSLKIEWNNVAMSDRHGVILGYTIQYTPTGDVQWQVIANNGKNNKSVEIFGLKNYTTYDVKVSAFNSKGNGPEGSIQVRTEEARPSRPPSSLLSYNTSSSSLWVEWTTIPKVSQRGTILGYSLIYHDTAFNITRELTIDGENTMSYNLTGLEEFREYRISVAGMNKMGIGPYITTIAVTDDDVPTAAPQNISGHFVSSSEIKISWSQPPTEQMNGQLTAINVFYKMNIQTAPTRAWDGLQYLNSFQSSNERNKTHESRHRRAILVLNKHIVYHSNDRNLYDQKGIYNNEESTATKGVFSCKRFTSSSENESTNEGKNSLHARSRREVPDVSGYSTLVINANESSVALYSLKPFMNYTILLQARTNKGSGPLSQPIFVQTGEDVPGAPPQNISTAFTSSTSIVVTWSPVPSADANGIIYAYIVSTKRANSTDEWMNYTQYEPNLSYELTDLMKYVVYSIKVRAVTIKGTGPFSETVYQRSDEDIPSASPANFSGEAFSSTGIFIKWRPVPENGEPSCCLHGILTSYKVSYAKKYPTPVDAVKMEALPASQISLNIWNLETFTPYTINVSASTVKGTGPISQIYIWTLEARPALAPQNETVRSKSSTALHIEWNEMPYMQRKGKIRGYAVYYRITKSNHPFSVKWLDMYHFTENYTIIYQPRVQVENDAIIRRLWYVLEGLYKHMEYTIHLTAYTKKGTGPWTYAKVSMTDEDVPSEAATNVTGHFLNSTAILVSWDPIRHIYDPSIEDPICCVHGNLTGYTIFYSRVTKDKIYNISIDLSYFHGNEIRNNNTDNVTSLNETHKMPSTKMHFVLTGLDSHKNYSIYVAGNTKKGHGEWGRPIFVQTDEDVPAGEPLGIRAWNISSTSVGVQWNPIIWEYRNGIIIYYTIYYRETLKPWQEDQSFNISAEFNSTVIEGLKKWTYYDIRVYGSTVKGQGILSANVTIQTDTDVPTMSPLSFTAVDHTGPYSIFTKWLPIPAEHRHGIILYYKISFFKYSEADRVQWKGATYEKIVAADHLSTYLEDLSTYCTYEITILGMTNKGGGVSSQPIRAKTCRCVKNLYTNWWQLPPYTFEVGIDGRKPNVNAVSNLSYIPKGLFPKFLRDMAVWSCQNCNGPRGHGFSVVHFDNERSGERSMKDSKSESMQNADEFVDFTFPVQGDTLQYKFISDGKFLPFIDHPSSAMIVVKKLKIIGKSEAVMSSIFSLWPVLLINFLFAIISGLIYWFLDHNSNPDELAQSFSKGSVNGFWWAYVTMTTVGYGDITPRSILAKIFSVIWMLTGLILFAILGSGLISSLSAKEQILMQPVKLYNNKVAVVNGTTEERIAMVKSARPIPKNSVEEVLETIKQGGTDAALVDTLVLSLYNDYFERDSLFVQEVITMSSFNLGIGLYGNITKLRSVFIDFIHSNQEELVAAMVQYVSIKDKGESLATVKGEDEESPSLFQPNSPIYRKALYTMSVTATSLVILSIIATIFISKIKKRNKKMETDLDQMRNSNSTYSACEKLFKEADEAWSNFAEKVEIKLQNLEQKHKEEHEWLVYLHKFINRCKKEAIDPRPFFNRQNISIRNWEKVSREGNKLKSHSQKIADGLPMLQEHKKRSISEIRHKASKDSSNFPKYPNRNEASPITNTTIYLRTSTQISRNLTESTFA